MTKALKSVFDQRAAGFEEFSDWSRNEELYRMCVSPLQDLLYTSWCLDLGGGTGWVARRNIRETGRRWAVLDLSYAMGQNAHPAVFVQGDAVALPFVDCSIGYVVIRSLLHFVPVPELLAETVRTLTPSGHLVVAQKVLPAATEAYEWYEALFRLRNPVRGRLWTEVELNSVLANAGLAVLHTEQFFEKREVQLERWITKDGTAPEESRGEVRRLLLNPPESVLRETKHRVRDGLLYFERTWAVTHCRRDADP